MTKPFDPKVRQTMFRGRAVWEVDCRAWPAQMRRMRKPQRRRFETEAEAIQWRRKVLRHEATGKGPDPGPMPVHDLCARFLSSVKRSERSPATYGNYRSGLKSFLAFLDLQGVGDVRSVTTQVIETYRLELFDRPAANRAGDRLKPGTIAQMLVVVSAMFSWACRMRILDRNPVEDIEIPHRGGSRRALTDDERRVLLQEASPEWRPVWMFMLGTGVRRGEMQALTIDDFELETPAPFVRVQGKGRKRRTIPLEGPIEAVARELVERAEAAGRDEIMTTTYYRFGDAWNRDRDRINRLMRERHELDEDVLGTDLSLHNLRHDCATRLANDGRTPLPEVSALLGHSSIQTTMAYVHRDERKLRSGLAGLGEGLERSGDEDWYNRGIEKRRREGKS